MKIGDICRTDGAFFKVTEVSERGVRLHRLNFIHGLVLVFLARLRRVLRANR